MKMAEDDFVNDIDGPYFNVETREVPGTEVQVMLLIS